MDGKSYSAKIRGGGYRSASISYLRIFATIMIVASHAWSTLPENPDMFSLTAAENTFLEIAYSLTKWCVPAFFMVTGALLLRKDKEISVKDCIWKYAKRMLLALVIFGIPYALLMIYFDTKKISLGMIPESIIRVINGDSFGHLWYLYTLIGIYLFLPFIKLFVNNASMQLFKYTMILMFIFNFCFPFINALTGLDIAFKLPLTTYPAFYLLMGYYIYNERPEWAERKWMAVAGIVISAVIIIAVGIARGPIESVMSYHSPVAVLFTVSIFMLFNGIKKESTERLWKTDRLCFGVYLIHPLFIQFCYKFLHIIPTGNSLYPVLSIAFAAAFVVIAFIASWVMSLIKPLKNYVL